MTDALHLRIDVADGLGDTWAALLTEEAALAAGWSLARNDVRPDAVAVIVAVGAEITPVDEPLVAIWVEDGTPRSPIVEESPPHLPARLELTVGAFRARRNQRVTRDALERFLARVEHTRPTTSPIRTSVSVDAGSGAVAPLDPAEAVIRADAAAIVAENRALLDAVDAWLARTSMTPEAAQAIGADRTILEAAIAAPVLDLVIIERAATRLAAAIAR